MSAAATAVLHEAKAAIVREARKDSNPLLLARITGCHGKRGVVYCHERLEYDITQGDPEPALLRWTGPVRAIRRKDGGWKVVAGDLAMSMEIGAPDPLQWPVD